MSATMLQLVQQATAEMGINVPNSVAGNLTQDVVQLQALLNAVGYEIQREHQWQALTVQYLFNTPTVSTTGDVTSGSAIVTNIPSTAGLSSLYQVTGNGINTNVSIVSVDSGTQVTLSQDATASGTTVPLTFSQTKYAMPAGFDRQIDATHWDKTQHWNMIGPETAQQWEWLVSGYISTGPMVRYRIFGSYFQIWPPQGTDHTLGFEYLSNLWVTASGGSAPTKTSFTVDTDTCIFPDRLMVLGLKKKYFEIKGFDTTAFARDYGMQLDIAKSNDAGSPTLSYAPKLGSVLIQWDNIPDSGYGS